MTDDGAQAGRLQGPQLGVRNPSGAVDDDRERQRAQPIALRLRKFDATESSDQRWIVKPEFSGEFLHLGGLVDRYSDELQSPPADFYSIFGMPRTLGLDLNELQARFYKLSRVLHPDHYSRKSEMERECSNQATAKLNDAWRTLRDPVTRAEYVLSQEGFEAAEQRANDVPPELLEEVFELNMALEELRMGDSSARPDLEAAKAKFIKMRDEIDRGLANLFAKYDLTHGRPVLGEIRGSLNRRRYVQNLVQEVEKELV